MANTITAAATVLVAAAVFAPAPARAGNVVLWACHSPSGEPLKAAPFSAVKGGDGLAQEYGGGCKEAGTGGLAATFSQADPEGGSLASWQLAVPQGVTLESVRIARTLSGFGEARPEDPLWYEALTSSEPLETASLQTGDPPLGGVLEKLATGRFVSLGVRCKLPAIESCKAPLNGETAGVDFSSIALDVLDNAAPTGAVGGQQSPVAGTLPLRLNASDTGLGLADAEASLEGGASTSVRLGDGACPEHPSPNASIEMPLDAACPKEVTGIPLPLDTTSVPDGEHTLRVSVTDAAGNTTTLVDRTITVQNNKPATGTTATATIGIASAGASSSAASGPAAAGGVLGFSSSTPGGEPVACQLPELSMKLTSKPLRYTKHHVPVLRSRHHYIFRGHLTCLLHNHRISAPTGIVLRALYTIKVGHRSYRTYASGRGTMTVHNGNLRAILAYYSSRTIIFRYKPGNGEFAQVKIPIEVVGGRPKGGGHAKGKKK